MVKVDAIEGTAEDVLWYHYDLERVMDFGEGKPMTLAWQGSPTQVTSRMTNGCSPLPI